MSERDRLSWHTSGQPGAVNVYGGWRAGNNAYLNGSTVWDRVVLVRDSAQVPEPPAWACSVSACPASPRRAAAAPDPAGTMKKPAKAVMPFS